MRRWVLCLLVGVAGAEDDRFAKDVANPALQRKIDEAIDKGVKYLKSIQRPGGYWGGPEDPQFFLRTADNSHTAGMTALCLYALSASGVAKDDPAVQRGLTFLFEHRDFLGGDLSCATYTNSCFVLALTRIDPVAYRTPLYEAADRLAGGQLANGMWTYILEPMRGVAPARAGDRAAWRKGSWGRSIPDNSNTQFSVLALWAAQEMADYTVPREVWEEVKKHFLQRQERDGGWSYRMADHGTSETMTAAGIASLVYACASLDGSDDALARARQHPALRSALRRLRIESPDAPWINYYWTYSLERVGTILALDVGTWYLPGAKFLVEHQSEDGGWGRKRVGFDMLDPQGTKAVEQMPYETSLALLFLTRATRHFVTTRTGMKPEGPLTKKETGPDTAEGLFDLYVATRPEEREALVPKLAKQEVVGLCIARLRESRQPVREAAFELLSRLVEKPFLFDPTGTVEERDVMLGPIEAFWVEKADRLEWDAERGRFVTR